MSARKPNPLDAHDMARELEAAANTVETLRSRATSSASMLRKAAALLERLHDQQVTAPGPAAELLAMKPDDFDLEFDGLDAPELLRRVLVRMWPIYAQDVAEAILSDDAIADSIDLILSLDKHPSDFADTMETLRDMSAGLDVFIDQLQERWDERQAK